MKNGLREDSLLRILSENYEALFYVDFVNNTIMPYRLNKEAEKIFSSYSATVPGYQEVMSRYVEDSVAPVDKEAMLQVARYDFLREELRTKRTFSYDYRVTQGEETKYFRIKISKAEKMGELYQAAVGIADVTAEMNRMNKLMESQMMLDLMEKDKLTGLYSKEFFFKRVEDYVAQHPEEKLFLWTSDVQGLKLINEKYGVSVGDEVLKILADSGVLIHGYLFGGRIEGDKFSALMRDADVDKEGMEKVLFEEITRKLPVPNVILNHGVYYIRRNTTLSAQGMYDRSLLALQSVKNKFGVRVGIYDDKLKDDLMLSRQLAEDAGQCLQNRDFKVYYQPKMDAEGKNVSGAEALVRWIHPTLGFLSPGVFIPLFEQSGFITSLDYYIWEESCKAMKEWKERGLEPIQVSVNVSRRDFEVPDLADVITKLVDRYGIHHSQFQIEITESSYSDNMERIQETIRELHNRGFSIALDDFGTGYSSMTALSNLDLDVMKLDMSMIRNDVPGTEKNVLEFSMQLAKMMRLKTVAEGVETETEVKRIQSLGVDYMQGYYYSKPVPKEEFEKYMAALTNS